MNITLCSGQGISNSSGSVSHVIGEAKLPEIFTVQGLSEFQKTLLISGLNDVL